MSCLMNLFPSLRWGGCSPTFSSMLNASLLSHDEKNFFIYNYLVPNILHDMAGAVDRNIARWQASGNGSNKH